MNLTFLQNELVLALCWTLLHSIWQGLLLAAATGIVMVSTRRSHPRKRYTVLTVLFFLFITGTVITFCRELASADAHPSLVSPAELVAQQVIPASVASEISSNSTAAGQTLLQRFTGYFNTHAALIVTIWFIIFMAKFLQLSANLVYVQRLKSYKVSEPAEEWKNKVQELMRKLGIHKKIRLMESGIVKVPVTMGMLKPVILLPFGLLSHLPADEIEAILLHELAHIQRRDYFVNLLQSLAETVFFFNPALLWLSSMMREERENCCDDLAISVTNNKTNFINALISFQEYHLSGPSHSMAFPGSKNQLLNRVKRIVSDRNKTLNAAEKSVLSFGIAIFILFSFVAARNAPLLQDTLPKQEKKAGTAQLPPAKKNVKQQTPVIKDHAAIQETADTASNAAISFDDYRLSALSSELVPLRALDKLQPMPGVQDTIVHEYKSFSTNVNTSGDTRTMTFTVTDKNGRELKFTRVNGVLKELFVNGKQVPEAEYDTYKTELDTIENMYQRKQEKDRQRRENERERRLQANEDKAQAMEQKMKNLTLRKSLETEKEKLESEDRNMRRKLFENKQKANDIEQLLKEKEKLIKEKEKLIKERDKLLKDKGAAYDLQLKVSPDVKPITLLLKPDTKVRLDIKPAIKPIELKVKPEHKVKLTLATKPFLRTDSAGNVNWGPYKTQPDSARKYRKHPDAPPVEQEEKRRIKKVEADERRNVAASVMRNIIGDLAIENIKVDTDKGWFALDKNQFLVDGKRMPEELHDKFRAKYVKGKDGMGWYYGDVKVNGRGIFLDNKEVPVK